MSNLVPSSLTVRSAATNPGASGGLFAAAKRLLGAGLRAFSNLHPAAKVLVVAGTALGAAKLLGGSKHEAAQRVQ